eukprot:scaffold38691_cov36-Prasinocladus_malaysianus.AAC.1
MQLLSRATATYEHIHTPSLHGQVPVGWQTWWGLVDPKDDMMRVDGCAKRRVQQAAGVSYHRAVCEVVPPVLAPTWLGSS